MFSQRGFSQLAIIGIGLSLIFILGGILYFKTANTKNSPSVNQTVPVFSPVPLVYASPISGNGSLENDQTTNTPQESPTPVLNGCPTQDLPPYDNSQPGDPNSAYQKAQITPLEPVKVTATKINDGVLVSWQDQAGKTNYEIYRRLKSSKDWQTLSCVQGSSYQGLFLDRQSNLKGTYVYGVSQVGVFKKSQVTQSNPISL